MGRAGRSPGRQVSRLGLQAAILFGDRVLDSRDSGCRESDGSGNVLLQVRGDLACQVYDMISGLHLDQIRRSEVRVLSDERANCGRDLRIAGAAVRSAFAL